MYVKVDNVKIKYANGILCRQDKTNTFLMLYIVQASLLLLHCNNEIILCACICYIDKNWQGALDMLEKYCEIKS